MSFRYTFGGPRQPNSYYSTVRALIHELQPTSTLRSLSVDLNNRGFTTPTGLEWNRDRLANFIRTQLNTN